MKLQKEKTSLLTKGKKRGDVSGGNRRSRGHLRPKGRKREEESAWPSKRARRKSEPAKRGKESIPHVRVCLTGLPRLEENAIGDLKKKGRKKWRDGVSDQ